MPDAMDDVLGKADSDFRFQLEEVGVDVSVQKKIIESGFTSLRVFAGLEETRGSVRAALKSTFGFDADSSPSMRKEVALLLCVWEAARTHLTYQEKNKQEAKLGTQNRLIQNSEYGAMRASLENTVGKLRDKEAPSKALVALKLEQVEDGVPIAEDLRDVTSFEDAEGEAYTAVIDPTTAEELGFDEYKHICNNMNSPFQIAEDDHITINGKPISADDITFGSEVTPTFVGDARASERERTRVARAFQRIPGIVPCDWL
ncbi:unnamed protein product [Symbiodinium natans]|uniref:Uncharacterized protein n=1 Tax=Symbiodinium natans TaxID=878477 RepID=A0A812UVX9_9DINO|nr:unnamed protein product [Symbiodinium natans]